MGIESIWRSGREKIERRHTGRKSRVVRCDGRRWIKIESGKDRSRESVADARHGDERGEKATEERDGEAKDEVKEDAEAREDPMEDDKAKDPSERSR